MPRKVLRGDELASFVKERQVKQVRMLRQAHGIVPKLLIVQSINASDVIATYVRMKQRYGADILIEVEVRSCQQTDMTDVIQAANTDKSVHGIIVQLPLDEPSETEAIVDMIAPEKDVDGLGARTAFVSATAEAIDWLLAGHSVELADKPIALLGNGKLVGRPLAKLWREQGYDVTVLDHGSTGIDEVLRTSRVIVSATGQPKVVNNRNVSPGTIVVDAGTVSEDGVIVGDTDSELQHRHDISITPPRGGVGPLTVVLLFDHVIRACLARIEA